jgi:hypothetical protein
MVLPRIDGHVLSRVTVATLMDSSLAQVLVGLWITAVIWTVSASVDVSYGGGGVAASTKLDRCQLPVVMVLRSNIHTPEYMYIETSPVCQQLSTNEL